MYDEKKVEFTSSDFNWGFYVPLEAVRLPNERNLTTGNKQEALVQHSRERPSALELVGRTLPLGVVAITHGIDFIGRGMKCGNPTLRIMHHQNLDNAFPHEESSRVVKTDEFRRGLLEAKFVEEKMEDLYR